MTFEKTIIINNDFGLHARPASDIVKIAKSFNSDISLYDQDKIADCKSVLSILLLGATKNTKLILKCTGNDAEIACKKLLNYMETNNI